MKKILAVLLLLCAASLGAKAPEIKAVNHRAEHMIVTATFVDGDVEGSQCTAYAIGPHELLTAEHCNDAGTLFIDKSWGDIKREWHGNTPNVVTEKYFDEHDHMILVIPSANFKDYVNYTAANYVPTVPGEEVYFWGNPDGVRDQFRSGYMSGVSSVKDQEEDGPVDIKAPIYFYALPVIGGDSGSAVFATDDNRLVAVVTYAVAGGKFMGAYTLAFTQDQLDSAAGRHGASCGIVVHGKRHRFECRP